eukprot:Polyplicarium_translucidae@DN3579_c0_g1_i1.p1
MEAAALAAAAWKVRPQGDVVSDGPRPDTLKAMKRYPFQPALQRMTVIARHEGQTCCGGRTAAEGVPDAPRAIVLMKGSPEVVKTFIESPPTEYDDIHRTAALQGHRVLAMASK